MRIGTQQPPVLDCSRTAVERLSQKAISQTDGLAIVLVLVPEALTQHRDPISIWHPQISSFLPPAYSSSLRRSQVLRIMIPTCQLTQLITHDA